MDDSAKYKRMAIQSKKLQSLWVPTIGDFWSCSCPSCNDSDYAWVLEQADVLAIDPKANLNNYYRDVKNATITSQDCGFGIMWQHRMDEPDDPGIVWLPRLDQLFKIAEDHLGMHFVHVQTQFRNWIMSQTQCHTPCSFPFLSLEQMALAWVSGLLCE